MPGSSCTIAVDMGTTTAKVVALADAGERPLAHRRVTLDTRTGDDGTAEQDPVLAYEAVTMALAETVAETRRAGHRIARVGFSAAMHSLLAIGPDDRPITQAILWMDSRARDEAERLWQSPDGPAVYERTGTPVHAMTPLAKLLWLGNRLPGVLNAAARLASLKEWVWHGWFGDWVADASMASATGLYNLRQADWDDGALSLAGIDRGRLSALVWPTFVQRGVREPRLLEAGLDADTPFNVGASDGVLANLGLGAIGEDGLVCSVGTSLALRAGRREPFTDAAARPFCYVLDRDRFIVGGASNSGGLILDWLGRVAVNAESTLREAGIGRLLAEAAGVETGTLVCLPYVAGERAPLWDASVRAAFVGIDAAHGPAHLVRAAVEGILLNARWMRDATLRAATPRTVTVNGRLFEHAWVRQLAADTFGLPVVHPETLDASLVGAARLARVATLDAGWSEVVKSDDERGELVGVSSRAGEALARYERFRRLGEMASTLLAPSRGGRSGGVPVIGPAAV